MVSDDRGIFIYFHQFNLEMATSTLPPFTPHDAEYYKIGLLNNLFARKLSVACFLYDHQLKKSSSGGSRGGATVQMHPPSKIPKIFHF